MILHETLFTFLLLFFSFLSLLLSIDDFHVSSVRQKKEFCQHYEHGTTCVQERDGGSDYRSIIFGNKRVSLL